MPTNLNIGILGHVDSGKTTLAKALSAIASTSAFDKSPQSVERGITLDLGFSALRINLPEHLKNDNDVKDEQLLQYTFVDCPGHASLIRTIIGGSQIIDLMILVVDITKGIQTQTAECIVIGQIIKKKILVVLNKIDQLDEEKKDQTIEKMTKRIKASLVKLGIESPPVVAISATTEENLPNLIAVIAEMSFIPIRNPEKPFLFAVDHCFNVRRGQGSICTGTVLQGSVKVGDEVEIAQLKISRKVKSIEMFKNPVREAKQGDRIGISITQFDVKSMERGFICHPGLVVQATCAVLKLSKVSFYRSAIRSNSKFHITAGHETTLATITLFSGDCKDFSFDSEYMFLDEVSAATETDPDHIFLLLTFERAISVVPGILIIGSKLDLDVATTTCRLAFFGNLLEVTDDKGYTSSFLPKLKIYKEKTKRGTIQRMVCDTELITGNLLKAGNREAFLRMTVHLTSGEIGKIESTFGQTSKVKLKFAQNLSPETISSLKEKPSSVSVELRYKKFLFHRDKKIILQ
ncbi:selenocysteine-specific elongation factor [Sergentomyia squamirostris]